MSGRSNISVFTYSFVGNSHKVNVVRERANSVVLVAMPITSLTPYYKKVVSIPFSNKAQCKKAATNYLKELGINDTLVKEIHTFSVGQGSKETCFFVEQLSNNQVAVHHPDFGNTSFAVDLSINATKKLKDYIMDLYIKCFL